LDRNLASHAIVDRVSLSAWEPIGEKSAGEPRPRVLLFLARSKISERDACADTVHPGLRTPYTTETFEAAKSLPMTPGAASRYVWQAAHLSFRIRFMFSES
jgi:hypothetical protein